MEEINVDGINTAIWNKFRIKRHDTLPFRGYAGKRENLNELLGELGYNYGAEIGVQRGLNAESMFKNNPNLHLVCVDPWKGFSRTINDEKNIEIHEECLVRLEPYNVTYMEMGSLEAVKLIPDGSLDFVYIDQMHDFDSNMMDLICWSPKVKRGGIVAGHDFCEQYQYGVIDAVKAYTRAHNIFMWYITREHEASYFWVR